MGGFLRFARHLKDLWKVVVRGEDELVHSRIAAVQEQHKQISEERAAQIKQIEENALKEVHDIVQEMKNLERSLTAAEDAANELIKKLAEDAKLFIITELEQEEKAVMKVLEKHQKVILNRMESTAAVTADTEPESSSVTVGTECTDSQGGFQNDGERRD